MITLKSFQTRALSAIVALCVIFAFYYYLNVNGLKVIVSFAFLMGVYELTKILFFDEPSKFLKFLFSLCSVVVFAFTTQSLAAGSLVYAISLIAMIVATLLCYNRGGDLNKMLIMHTKSSLGLFYVALLPAFIYRILDSHEGISWFVFLLSVVFAGDTLAYVTGVLVGKHKVMPTVSPKKTWEGSIGGLFGSLLAGLICWLVLFSEQNLIPLLIMAALAGFVGQFGDFFESLLKRVANVKDSGRIMPGHGGVLDRVDAVLFAGPIVLAGLLILSHYSI